MLARAADAAARADPGAAVRAVEMLPAAQRSGVVRELTGIVARQDVTKAARLAEAMPAGALQTAAAEIVARAMLEREPAAAVEWALAPASPAAEFAVRQAVAEEWAERGPRAAVTQLLGWPATAGRDELLGLTAAGYKKEEAAE